MPDCWQASHLKKKSCVHCGNNLKLWTESCIELVKLVISRFIRTKILEMLHNSKWVSHLFMTRMKSSIG